MLRPPADYGSHGDDLFSHAWKVVRIKLRVEDAMRGFMYLSELCFILMWSVSCLVTLTTLTALSTGAPAVQNRTTDYCGGNRVCVWSFRHPTKLEMCCYGTDILSNNETCYIVPRVVVRCNHGRITPFQQYILPPD